MDENNNQNQNPMNQQDSGNTTPPMNGQVEGQAVSSSNAGMTDGVQNVGADVNNQTVPGSAPVPVPGQTQVGSSQTSMAGQAQMQPNNQTPASMNHINSQPQAGMQNSQGNSMQQFQTNGAVQNSAPVTGQPSVSQPQTQMPTQVAPTQPNSPMNQSQGQQTGTVTPPAMTQTPPMQNNPAAAQATPNNVVPMPTTNMQQAGTGSQAKDTKILIVEDEIDARTMFVDLLNSEGYECSSAVDGVDALAKAAADKFDLILLDIVMPNKDGIEVLQEIKANPDKYGSPIVVMLTNISGDAAVEKAMELGAAGFRLKVKMEPTELIEDVQAFLNGKVQNLEEEPVAKAIA